MIGVLHAYGRQNAGDGLLVDLTSDRLARAGRPAHRQLVVALDPASFDDLPHVTGCGTDVRRPSRAAMTAAAASLATLASTRLTQPATRLDRTLRACDALVAVGGGYLRTPDRVSSVGTAVNHLPQLEIAARSEVPTLYLPQSIGPLTGPVGRRIHRLLAEVDVVCVRDQPSLTELGDLPNVVRLPDLALLHLAETGTPDVARHGGTTVLVGREVSGVADLGPRLESLAGLLGPHRFAVQAGGDRSKSDRAWYRSLGFEDAGPLGEVLHDDRCDVVVSVRLHGAIMSLLRGVPAVHLSYDRKGPAAYADLGIPEFCFDVETFNPAAVAGAVEEIRRAPDEYWRRLARPLQQLQDASRELDRLVAKTLGA